MDALDVGRLVLIVSAPTLLGAAAFYAPEFCARVAARRDRHRVEPPQPYGPPIERLARDLRRLIRLHAELTASAHISMRAHRLWAVEAALTVRATEAARALGVPHREADTLSRAELVTLLRSLADAGLVLPEVTPLMW